MISLIPIFDIDELKTLFNKDDLYKSVLGTDTLDNWTPDVQNILWFKAINNNKTIGVIFFRVICSNCLAFHAGVYKEFRGVNSSGYLKECLNIVRKDSNMSFVTMLNSNQLAAKKAVEAAGFIYKTTIKNGYIDGNMLLYGEE